MANTSTDKPATASGGDAKPTKAKATAVPKGHRRIVWTYNAAQPELTGHAVDMPEAEAADLVAGNRARYAEEGQPLGPVERKLKPARRAFGPGTAPADTSSAGESGSATA